MSRLSRWGLFCLLTTLASLLWPESGITDSRGTIKVGMCVFSGIDLDVDSLSLQTSVPQQLLREIKKVPSRYLGDDEMRAYRRMAYIGAIMSKGADLQKSVKERDTYLFTSDSDYDLTVNRMSKRDTIDSSRKELGRLVQGMPSDISVSRVKPLEWKQPTDAELFPAVNGDLGICALQNDLDIVIAGSVEQIDGYYLVRLRAYHRVMDAEILSAEATSARDDFPARLHALGLTLADALAGRADKSITLIPTPANADVYLDGNYAGTGTVTLDYLEPGKHRLSLSATGYAPREEIVSVDEETSSEYRLALEKLTLRNLAIKSDPPGASVYLGATNIGRTPLEMRAPNESVTLTIRLDGFQDKMFVLTDEVAAVDLALEKDEVKFTELYNKRRDSFYGSFGLFVLSIPCVMLTYSGWQSLYYAAASSSTELSDDFIATYYAWNVAFFGAAGLSGILLGNCVIHFIPYIKISNY
jgi:hypothetical protein